MVIASSSTASRDRHAPALPPSGQAARPRIDARLEGSVRAHRVTVVAAPSGFGKTSAVAAWAADRPGRVAWLTLRAFDDRPATVTPAIVRTLQTVLPSVAGPGGIPSIDREGEDVHAVFEHVAEAISGHDEPLCLVIDDAHRAGSALAEGLLGALVDAGPENLRLVVIGTGSIDGTLARWVLSHPSSVIRGDELAFDQDEVAALAGTAPDDPWVERMLATTQGWPIAVRFLHLTGLEPERAAADVLLRDYVHDHVIRQLPPHLRRFVLDTAVCDELTVELATAITGRTDASALLRRCIRLGLFLDRYDTPSGVVYRWHRLFASACREILDDIDTGRQAQVHVSAAGHLEAHDPLAAVTHWLH
ncbi:MAG: AAA family ATPase, partial [Gemmatimonadota bacterium]|nr:AAA family ATPase [Gemmatimonadota bacterium]